VGGTGLLFTQRSAKPLQKSRRRIKELIPEARVLSATPQLRERRAGTSNVRLLFTKSERTRFSTIIETGIDIAYAQHHYSLKTCRTSLVWPSATSITSSVARFLITKLMPTYLHQMIARSTGDAEKSVWKPSHFADHPCAGFTLATR